MGGLTAAELLDIWERALGRPLAERALMLLVAASPGRTVDELARLSVGRRDARLLRLREQLFGPELILVARCPGCGEQVESAFQIDDVRVGDDQEPSALHAVDVNGYHATFRVPTTEDLLALTDSGDAATARAMLLTRCVADVRDVSGRSVGADRLPDDVVAGVEAEMAAVDPQADVTLLLACPTCAHTWTAALGIAGFLWKELHAWALRTLRDVDCLARSYGWREADVLALSPMRRQMYIELSRP